jgi:hypothetical protein
LTLRLPFDLLKPEHFKNFLDFRDNEYIGKDTGTVKT